jgi:hypothetical protein
MASALSQIIQPVDLPSFPRVHCLAAYARALGATDLALSPRLSVLQIDGSLRDAGQPAVGIREIRSLLRSCAGEGVYYDERLGRVRIAAVRIDGDDNAILRFCEKAASE